MSKASPRERPLSPHTGIWRWHIQTMGTSILHRLTGIAIYGGALILGGWALSLGFGQGAYQSYMELLGSPLGRVVMFGLTVALFYHLANGVRHLIWDSGEALDLKSANASGWFTLIAAPAAAVLVWVYAGFTGAL